MRKLCPSGQVDGRDIIEPFAELCIYLQRYPQKLSWRGKNRPSLMDREGVARIAERYFKEISARIFPVEPRTVPDEMVSVILRSAYGYSVAETERIKTTHKRSMAAENLVGELLESYLDSILRAQGWIWCVGSMVRSVDFLKADGEMWIELQVKNRDNSENSSSSAIRNNTEIKKWFRTYSRTGRTNWENFPIKNAADHLSEAGFMKYVTDYLAETARLLEKR